MDLSLTIYVGFYNESTEAWERLKWFSEKKTNQFESNFNKDNNSSPFLTHDKIFENNFDDFEELVEEYSFPHSSGYKCLILRDLKKVIDNLKTKNDDYENLIYIFRKTVDLVFEIYGITDLSNIRLIFKKE